MNRSHILVVEDEATLAAVITTNLTRHGCQITVAGDGQAAWELIKQAAIAFDAILLDRLMPRMDGLTLLRRLRARPETARVPILMVTSVNDQTSILECLQAGAYYYLTKPLDIELLLVVVRAAVEQSREQRRLQELVRQADQGLRFLFAGTFYYS
jgi:DNA-binding response OmpR family regulator